MFFSIVFFLFPFSFFLLFFIVLCGFVGGGLVMSWGGGNSHSGLIEPSIQQYFKLSDRIWEQIEKDELDTHVRVTDPSSDYYQDVHRFGSEIYNFYNCSRCNEMYFGGRRECDMELAAPERRPDEYICSTCASYAKMGACGIKGHEDAVVWKCHYCCSAAVWFCGGTTHYCEPCHSGGYNKNHSCPPAGLDTCPIGLPTGHPQGEEKALGCGLCSEVLMAQAKVKVADANPNANRVTKTMLETLTAQVASHVVLPFPAAPTTSTTLARAAAVTDDDKDEKEEKYEREAHVSLAASSDFAPFVSQQAVDAEEDKLLRARLGPLALLLWRRSCTNQGAYLFGTKKQALPPGVLNFVCTLGGTGPWRNAVNLKFVDVNVSSRHTSCAPLDNLMWSTHAFNFLGGTRGAATAFVLPPIQVAVVVPPAIGLVTEQVGSLVVCWRAFLFMSSD